MGGEGSGGLIGLEGLMCLRGVERFRGWQLGFETRGFCGFRLFRGFVEFRGLGGCAVETFSELRGFGGWFPPPTA